MVRLTNGATLLVAALVTSPAAAYQAGERSAAGALSVNGGGDGGWGDVVSKVAKVLRAKERHKQPATLSVARRAEQSAGAGVTVKYFGVEGVESRTSRTEAEMDEAAARQERTKQWGRPAGEQVYTGESGRWVSHTWRPEDDTIPSYVSNNYELSHKPNASRCGFTWDDAAAKAGKACEANRDCWPPLGWKEEGFWPLDSNYTCYMNLPDYGYGKNGNCVSVDTSQFTDLFCQTSCGVNQPGSWCPYDKCRCEKRNGTAWDLGGPIQALPDNTSAKNLPARDNLLVQEVRRAWDKLPSGLPACLWKPYAGCSNSTPFECIEGESIHTCAAGNWFDLLPAYKPPKPKSKHTDSKDSSKDSKDSKATAKGSHAAAAAKDSAKGSKPAAKPAAVVKDKKGDPRFSKDDPRYAVVKEEVKQTDAEKQKQATHQADIDAIEAANAAAIETATAKHKADIDAITAGNDAATEAAAPTAAATVHPNQVKKHSPTWVAKHTATPGKKGIHEHSATWVAKHAKDLVPVHTGESAPAAAKPTAASSSRHGISLFTEGGARAEEWRNSAHTSNDHSHAPSAHEKPAHHVVTDPADHSHQVLRGNKGEKPVCRRSCLHVSLLHPVPYYPLWNSGAEARPYARAERQPRYEHTEARLTFKTRGIDLRKSDMLMSRFCKSVSNRFAAISMYSPRYEDKAERLVRSCERVGVCCKAMLLPADAFGPHAPEGSEAFRFEAIATKPAFILSQLDATNLPVVYMDVDLEFHQYPTLFSPGSWPDFGRDVAVFNFWGNETDRKTKYTTQIGSAVAFFNRTDRAKAVARAWAEAMAWEGNRQVPDDQVLDLLLTQGGWLKRASFGWLPTSYLRTFPSYYRGVVPVIDHDHGSPPGLQKHSDKKPRYPPVKAMDLCDPDDPSSAGHEVSLPPGKAEAEATAAKEGGGGLGCQPGTPGAGGCHAESKKGAHGVSGVGCAAAGAACCHQETSWGRKPSSYCARSATGQALACVDGKTCQEAGAAALTWDDLHPGSKDVGKVAAPPAAKDAGKAAPVKAAPKPTSSPAHKVKTWDARHPASKDAGKEKRPEWDERHVGQKKTWAEREADRKASAEDAP